MTHVRTYVLILCVATLSVQAQEIAPTTPGATAWKHREERLADSGALRRDGLTERMRVDASIATTRRLLGREPDIVAGLVKLGNLLLQAGRTHDAAEAFWRAARTEPDNLEALHSFGAALVLTGDTVGAARMYEKLRERHPQHPDIRFHLAWTYFRANKHEKALAVLCELLQDQPDWLEVPHNLGVVCQAMGRPDEALSWFERSAE